MSLELYIGNRVPNKMRERGISLDEIRDAILTGEISQAALGRMKATCVFAEGYHYQGIDYPHKEVQVVYVVEPWATVVATVIARYGFWREAA